MDRNRRTRMTPFRRDLVVGFAGLSIGSVGAALYLYTGAGPDASEVRILLAVFLVAIALLVYVAAFVRNA